MNAPFDIDATALLDERKVRIVQLERLLADGGNLDERGHWYPLTPGARQAIEAARAALKEASRGA